MIFYCIGVDFKIASLTAREEIYRRREGIMRFVKTIDEGVVVLFTCNRIELYGTACDDSSVQRIVAAFEGAYPWIFENAYVKKGDELIRHAVRLASGLNSHIMAEVQIREQLISWCSQQGFPELLKKIWKAVLYESLLLRAQSGLENRGTTIADIVIDDLRSKGKSENKKDVVVIGTGAVARSFVRAEVADIRFHFVSRKKHKRAKQLAKASGGAVLLLDELRDVLWAVDAVISATASPHYVIKDKDFFTVARGRKIPLYVYDLAVPRDIDPNMAETRGVEFYNLESFNTQIDEHNQTVYPILSAIEQLLDESVQNVKRRVNEYFSTSGNAAEPVGIITG